MPLMKPLLYGNGGPIIMLQVENEYGEFGCDANYLKWMYNETNTYVGDKAVLFTNHIPNDRDFRCGKIDNVFITVDFGLGNLFCLRIF